MKKDYLVVVNEEHTRDIQVAQMVEVDHTSDDWADFQGEVVLGIFAAESKEQAVIYGSDSGMDLPPESLSAYLLADNQPKG